MHDNNSKFTGRQLAIRGLIMIVASFSSGLLAHLSGFESEKMILATAIFFLIISATLLFWNFRLAIAFIGIAILLGGQVLTLEQMVLSAELDIILFLVGMMCLVGVLKDLGLFTWVIQLVINMKAINGLRFTIILIFMSAFMACVVDEVTSIVFVLALVFQVCDTLKIKPTPFVMIAVMATNIGSSGTMLGNPVGILIGGIFFRRFFDVGDAGYAYRLDCDPYRFAGNVPQGYPVAQRAPGSPPQSAPGTWAIGQNSIQTRPRHFD